MKTEIQQRFETNLGRIRGLVTLYDSQAKGPGRRDVNTADLLRAAVVLLHAAFEDLVRSVLEWKLPLAPHDKLGDIPLGGVATDEAAGPLKFVLVQLAEHHRGRSVDDVIALSVRAWLLRSNFNNAGELHRALERVSLAGSWLDPHKDALAAMMKRRHWIVHRADRNTEKGSGHHPARSLQRATVSTWADAVEDFGSALLGKC